MKTLIKTFREVADLVESEAVTYAWDKGSQCNCGIVARHILGYSKDEMSNALISIGNGTGMWSDHAEKNCSISNISHNNIFKILLDAGLKFKDFHHLEFLSDPQILKRSNIVPYGSKTKDNGSFDGHYKQKENFIAYIRAWADMLQEEEDKLDFEAQKVAATILAAMEKVEPEDAEWFSKHKIQPKVEETVETNSERKALMFSDN